jgi:uncharacterized membrane protein YedE/YeeE
VDLSPSVVASALLAGFAFGYVAQRGGFCLTRALSNLVLMGDTTVARAYLLALLVAVVGTWLLTTIGQHLPVFEFAEQIPVRPFRWLANLVGGFVFGIGMVLSGGCSGSTWYRVGEGAVGAWIVLLGFALGATATNVGLLAGVRQTLQQPELTLGDQPVTLYTVATALLGVPSWVAVAVVALAAGLCLLRGHAEAEHRKWRWPVSGTAMGLVIVLGWYLSSFGGAPVGVTFAENTGHLLTYPLVWFPNRVTWGMLLLAGVPLGSGLAACRSGEFAWRLPQALVGLQLFAGGLIMGIGALIAQGCNITQGLTYASTLAVGSLTAFAAMLAGGWVTLWLLFLRK